MAFKQPAINKTNPYPFSGGKEGNPGTNNGAKLPSTSGLPRRTSGNVAPPAPKL